MSFKVGRTAHENDMRRESCCNLTLGSTVYSASTPPAAGVVSCWFRARMLGRRELWLLPAQDDMSCCGARTINLGGEES